MTEQMKHPETLTEQELVGVTDFWRNYILSGGDGASPTAFQLEAVNNEAFRDAFLFWQVGGNPYGDDPHVPAEVKANYDRFGPVPTNEKKAVQALTQIIKAVPPEVETIDTGTVFIIASVMWMLRMGRIKEAGTLLLSVHLLNKRRGGSVYHRAPLAALMESTTMLLTLPPVVHTVAVGALLGISTVDQAMATLDEELDRLLSEGDGKDVSDSA